MTASSTPPDVHSFTRRALRLALTAVAAATIALTAGGGTALGNDQGDEADPTLEAARSFTTLLILVALVGAFLAFQGWIDRREPKLVESSIDRRDRHFS